MATNREERLKTYIKSLEGISYDDWWRLRLGIDKQFDHEKRELEKTLQLSDLELTLRLTRP